MQRVVVQFGDEVPQRLGQAVELDQACRGVCERPTSRQPASMPAARSMPAVTASCAPSQSISAAYTT